MKKLLLIYWTGTYNTRYITDILSKRFENEYQINKVEVTINCDKNIDLKNYDLIGIGYPIYGFNMPGFFQKFLKCLNWNTDAKVFIYKKAEKRCTPMTLVVDLLLGF